MQYIILDGKTPTHKFKDGVGAKTWDEAKDFDDVAVIVPKGYIVLDFDTVSDAEIMLKIVEALDLKCRVMKTTRGIHCWFKTEEESPKCFTKTRLAVGIYCDRKSGGRNAYVKIKQDGKARKWIKKIPFSDVETVPKWLSPVSAPANKFSFKGMGDGSGRNQELFNYIVYLQTKGFNKAEIKETIAIINRFVFAEPLSDGEINLICRDEAFKPDDVIAEQVAQAERRSGWSHNEFGDELINAFNIVTVNGQLYVYEDGYYQQDERIIERKMIDLYPSIKQTQRSETLSYIRIKTHINSAKLKVNPYVINLNNTRLDVRSGECLEYTPKALEFDRIPVTYDPSAYCADLDKMLNRVFLCDNEVINLFKEMVGACLLKHNRYQKAFLLYGSGSNGKSTILDLVKKFLGKNNITSIELDKLTTDKFAPAELENKLANIGDDINDSALRDTGTLKKLFSGNSILVQRKGERPFELEPYATHIFSGNSIPRSFDKSDGFYRRWILVPFVAKFSTTDEDYDPLIEDKITTDAALSYLLNLGLEGVMRLIENGKFTEPESVKRALAEYKTENSTVLSWIDDKGLDEDYFTENATDKVYSDFIDWCKLSGIKTNNVTGKKTFNKEVVAKFGFEDKPKQRADGKRYFIIKI